MTWQPIETAPRDGTPVLLYITPDVQCVGEWSTIVGAFYHGETDRIAPTHWQPLPEPPGSERDPKHMTHDEYKALLQDHVAELIDETGKAAPQSCGLCRFWQESRERAGIPIGNCLRYPPADSARAGENSAYPTTPVKAWCGEWAARKAEPIPVDTCPKTGGDHVWLDTSTFNQPSKMCQKCGREG